MNYRFLYFLIGNAIVGNCLLAQAEKAVLDRLIVPHKQTSPIYHDPSYFDYIKNKVGVFFMRVLRLQETSQTNQDRVTDILKRLNLKYKLKIFNMNWDGPAGAVQEMGFIKIMYLNSRFFNDGYFDMFTLYHEIGHLFHHHHIKIVLLYTSLFIAINYIIMRKFINKWLPSNCGFTRSVLEAITICGSFLIIKYLTKPLARSLEREADLFACHQLLNNGSLDVVFLELRTIRGQQKHFELEAWPNFYETHPSSPERHKYLKECLKNHNI